MQCLENALTWFGEIQGHELLHLFQRVALGFSLCECLGYAFPLWKEFDCSYLECHWLAQAWWWTVYCLPARRAGQITLCYLTVRKSLKSQCYLRVVLAAASNTFSRFLEAPGSCLSKSTQLEYKFWIRYVFLRYINLTSLWSYIYFCDLSCNCWGSYL